MSLRDERAAALTRRHRDLSDDFTRTLPGLLDDLDAIDRAHTADVELDIEIDEYRAKRAAEAPGTGSVPPPGPVPPVPVSDKPPKAPPAARTAPRRRTGGTHA